MRLTERGASLFAGVHGALLDIAQTLDALRPAPDAGALTVSTTHSFAALWLVPRLGRFHQAYPQYQLRLDANARPVDLLQDASVDVAIRYSQKRYPALVAACSLPESFGVYGAPALAARLGGARAGREAPALVTVRWRDSRLYDEGWRQWCEAAGLPRWRKPAAIHAYEEEHYALQAAIAGQGLVLASSVMVSDSVRLGALAPLRPEVRVPGAAYTALCAPARTASAGARLPGLAGARIRGLSRARGYHVGHCLRAARHPGRARNRRTRTVNRFQEMTVFLAVAEAQSFAAAARRLRMSAPSVTRSVAALERRLGVLLLLRTTRSLRLTEANATRMIAAASWKRLNRPTTRLPAS